MYIVRKRAKFNAFCGPVNLPYGTEVDLVRRCLVFCGKELCVVNSKSSYDYFCYSGDGHGVERARLIEEIYSLLNIRKSMNIDSSIIDKRWKSFTSKGFCQKYRNKEFSDYWLFGEDFYKADIDDLRQIKGLILSVKQ